MAGKESENVTKAKNILRGKTDNSEYILELANKLKGEKAFDYARKILSRALENSDLKRNRDLFLKISQQCALCTYKDQNLTDENKFDDALKILDDAHIAIGESLSSTKNQETLGLAGAIQKYKWNTYGQKNYLELALTYYLRGYKEGVESDHGYTGINAAFVLDLLANLESDEIKISGPGVVSSQDRHNEAKHIRREITKILPTMVEDADKAWLRSKWWFLVTVAEAYLGLEEYEEASKWLNRAVALSDVPDWEKESTTRQFAAIVYIIMGDKVWKKEFEQSKAYGFLNILIGKEAIYGALLGKTGLALSGGGFRASLFHIGVLAKLAELDILRHIEVLSCVSGGSIIGAYYYLELRELLSRTSNEGVTKDDYIEIVKRIIDKFLCGVQRNLRTRVAAELFTNLKMIFLPNYSRTLRIGELYEEELFSRVWDGHGPDALWLNDLFIKPKNEIENFSPKYQNWRMAAKVPMIILNATTLNTGHVWQFTASWMGEPPSSVDTDIDANFRLRRMYYSEAPGHYKNMRLGHAVAASSCVPGLFEPIAFPKLYPKDVQSKITVRLVDGGVHDNQGITSLLEQDCSLMIVSDASGQMGSQKLPSKGILGVPLRSNSILMSRVREAEYRELSSRRRYSALRGFMFVHLNKELDVDPIDWIGCQDSPEVSQEKQTQQDRPLTKYGIRKDIQHALAEIRTDLDSFSQAEAYALMMSGYSMTELEFPESIKEYKTIVDENVKWNFKDITGAMRRDAGYDDAHKLLLRLLKVGHTRAFKIFKLSPVLNVTAWIGIILMLAVLLWICWNWAHISILSFGMIGIAILFFILVLTIGKVIFQTGRILEVLIKISIGIVMSLLGWIFARIHLYIFDPLFKKRGSLHRLLKLE